MGGVTIPQPAQMLNRGKADGVCQEGVGGPYGEASWHGSDDCKEPLGKGTAFRRAPLFGDLASGKVRMALLTTDLKPDTALTALEMLIERHGAPLIITSDNGCHFIADTVRHMLKRHRVLHLYYPPYTPGYNRRSR